MKLIYIAPFLSPVGGLERTLTDKANYLIGEGHEVMFLTFMQGQGKVFYDLDPRIAQVDIDCPIHTIFKHPIWKRLGKFLQLKHLFRERLNHVFADFRPNVVVITIPNTELFIHDIVKVAQAHNVKVVVESHLASLFHLKGKYFTVRVLCKLFPPITAIRKADLLIALTKRDADNWCRRQVPKVTVIPNPSTYYSDDVSDVNRLKGRIIAVGRLSEQKRFDRLIDAFSLIAAKYPSWYIDVFGDGPLSKSLNERIEKKNLIGRVRLNSPTRAIILEYQRSQFYALSSDYEGFGLVIIEAMSCGIPVVATDCPYGPSEIIDDGKTGLLAKMEVQDLADKMEWMITHDAERQQMGLNAHQAAARYKMDVVMPEWEKAYQNA